MKAISCKKYIACKILLVTIALVAVNQAYASAIVGSVILNGDFNANPGTSVDFVGTSGWVNIGTGYQTVGATRDNLAYDGTQNGVVGGTPGNKIFGLDTGYTITEDDVFSIRYVWRDAWLWIDNSDQIRVVLFVTDDNTLAGMRTDLVVDLSGTSKVDSAYEAVEHTALYTASMSDAGRTLFVAIDGTNTAEAYARLDNFELSNASPAYYIDSINGNDGNSGMSPYEAWSSLSPVNAAIFAPDDHILFKAGTSYTGQFKPQGSGTESNPILVDLYGSGDKPLIDGAGYLAAVFLEDIEYWELNNLELTSNKGVVVKPDALDQRYGVYMRALDTGTRNHIYLRDLYIHDIFATGAEHGQGIAIESDGNTIRTNYKDILIENCHIQTTSTHGIWLQHRNWYHPGVLFAYNQNIMIRNNILEDIGGPGIQPNHCKQVLIEYNDVESGQIGPNQRGRGSGFWNWHCEDVTVQYNTFKHARGEGDSCGAHVDIGNINTTIQYNLSYDNAGGFMEILGDSYNTIYRYNVSINDGWRVKGTDGATQHGHMLWLGGWTGSGKPKSGPFNSHIYNNTIYLAAGLTSRILLDDSAEDAYFRNNIYYIDGTVIDENSDSTATNMNFDYNLSTQSLPSTLPVDPHGIVANPLLVNPGGWIAEDYRLLYGSPAINAGVSISDDGGQDYWSNPISDGLTDRGVYEFLRGDLNLDQKVDMEDVAELGIQWQIGYDMNTLLDIANNWLYGTSL
ncbi:MAG: right-handed parallel beta-helix repeat-containing protein [Anaerohalosphaera sp.]|nr:right-handed parallel beta-helix repeat-containing protein [Anaerohalosphaera sp.]